MQTYLTEDEVNNSKWKPLTPQEVLKLFNDIQIPWWMAGGYAIEFYVGTSFRNHEDIDLIICRDDMPALKNQLPDWQFYISDKPGTLRYWQEDQELPKNVYDIWLRKDDQSPWQIQIMVNDHEGKDFLYKRDNSIRFNIEKSTSKSKQGIPYLNPEIQLLHKAKSPRIKDHMDLQHCLPRLSRDQKEWLKMMIVKCYSKKHLWLIKLES